MEKSGSFTRPTQQTAPRQLHMVDPIFKEVGRPASRRNLVTSCLVFSVFSLVAVNYPSFSPAQTDAIQASVSAPSRSTVLPASFSQVAAEPTTPTKASDSESAETTAPAGQNAELFLAISKLKQAERTLEQVADYTGVFKKRERIDGELSEQNHMRVKVRHEPFSVYFAWVTPNEGREVIYVEGQNDGRLLAHEGGLASLFVPLLRLDPLGSLALRDNRHPITHFGLRYLTSRLLKDRRADLEIADLEVSMDEVAGPGDRPCWRFEHQYTGQSSDNEYGGVVYYIDKELVLPVRCDTFDWGTGDAQGQLLESYVYLDLRFDAGLTDVDFSTSNPEYKFPRF